MTKPARYWALHMTKSLRAPTEVFPEELPPISIQLLASDGGPSEQIGYIGPADQQLEIEGHSVPLAVISAARSLEVGCGAYLDEDGQETDPF